MRAKSSNQKGALFCSKTANCVHAENVVFFTIVHINFFLTKLMEVCGKMRLK